ncbi:S-adenosyl-L-methionine-dependent methyltransferase [Rickenella mellea]|uniref:S-adenosyl-L-methionine-dependent methyltransferase n=1 Tax=Rickenella mellea TaxID=50990 RepID=A0A4Y7QG12_9AGAM|nr:S-adenosyl-L-methionine-dependent methyltransferase [Rickenella mellea]
MFIERDVARELEKGRKRFREPGHVPYPVEYSNDIGDFNVLEMLMGQSIQKSISIHKFVKPPNRVLDLGCGTGTWIIAAAKEWPNTAFVGFDIADIQPDLTQKKMEIGDLHKRITWVHGNFLERLPFLDEEFEFVRIHDIGLGVPEDEWQDVIEEVARVLKPGGVLEVMEYDIIFPCADPPIPETPSPPSPSGTITQASQIPEKLKNSNGSDSVRSTASSTPSLKRSGSAQLLSREPENRRDHSALKDAFHRMLTRRFINPNVLSVLPFYLQTSFKDVQSHPHFVAHLPPPSDGPGGTSNETASFRLTSDSGIDMDFTHPEQMLDIAPRNALVASAFNVFNTPKKANIAGRLSLARAMRLVIGCKEEMWVEYERLHREKREKPNPRLDREEFEMHFQNWENDMQDRINLRGAMMAGLNWKEPTGLDHPPWRTWKEKEKEGREPPQSSSSFGKKEASRSHRIFICTKEDRTDHQSAWFP